MGSPSPRKKRPSPKKINSKPRCDCFEGTLPQPRSFGKINWKRNKTEIIIENEKVKGLIDSRAQVSSISDTFASKLGLEIKQLDTLLNLEPTGGGQVPYNGYVELQMRVPNVRAFVP